MLFDYAAVFVFLVFSIIFVCLNMLLSKLLSPKAANALKAIPYECGELPVGTPWIRFNPRYYIYAIMFLIFDVEIALMYPCAVVFRQWVEQHRGGMALTEIAIFSGILLMALAYVWRKGDLNWVKHLTTKEA